jgi:TetR/AcrR family transcriptional repressor of nem operon
VALPDLTEKKDMGRKLEFDRDEAVEQATRLFWERGYVGASLRDLLKVMRIGESSFYHLFGSKRQLYLKCLEHYNDTITRRRLAILESEPSVRKAVRKFFYDLLEELEKPKTPRICLMARSLSTDVLDDDKLRPCVTSGMDLFEKQFVLRLQKAKKEKELPADFPAETAAQIVITYLQGFFRVVHVLKNRQQMWRQVETLLDSLGL